MSVLLKIVAFLALSMVALVAYVQVMKALAYREEE